MRLLVYALGGGLGHLQRSLSLCRSAGRRGHQSVILSNSPAWPRVAANLACPGVRVQHLGGNEHAVPAAANSWLERDDFDALIVDTLPRGIVGELAHRLPNVPTVFVHRDLTADYASKPGVIAAVQRFDLMLCPGERGPLQHRNAILTAPWVMFDSDELLERSAVRAHFACPADRALCVVCDATDRSEADGLAALAHALRQQLASVVHVHLATLEDTWPLQRLHLGIDLLIGSGGYNTVHEARLSGTPLRAIPRQRFYDRQHRRLQAAEWLDVMDLSGFAPQARVATPYSNGAVAAVQAIECLVMRQ